jgi:hypothetical protein
LTCGVGKTENIETVTAPVSYSLGKWVEFNDLLESNNDMALRPFNPLAWNLIFNV